MVLRNAQSLISNSRGFSLIELMVSVVIGVIVINGVLQVVASSKKSYSDHQEVSFIQENARYAIDVMSRDIRMAGYRGCANETQNVVNVIADAVEVDDGISPPALTSTGEFLSSVGIQGYDKDTGYPQAIENDITTDSDKAKQPDSVIVRRGDYENEYFVEQHVKTTSTLTLTEDVDFVAGTPLIISHQDCRNVGIFVASAVSGDEVKHLSGSANCSSALGGSFNCDDCSNGDCGQAARTKPYNSGSRLMKYVANAYYIGPSSVLDNTPALKREVLVTDSSGSVSTRSEELAIGVENMKITYGIDSNDDLVADTYVAADHSDIAADWSNVLVVRVALTLRSESPVDAASGGNDGYMRQVVNSTINIRNRG